MIIENNADFSRAIEDLIKESGLKKIYIAEKIGIANQNLNRKINKKSISIDSANEILSVIGYRAKVIIEKK